jgi:hypothetical protein
MTTEEVPEENGEGERCSVMIEQLTQVQWHKILCQFEDASLHQTWPLGAARWGAENLYHAVITRDGTIMAAAQIAVRKMGPVGAVAAYISWGPVWRRDGSRDRAAYNQLLIALRRKFVEEDGYMLALMPTDPGLSNDFDQSMKELGFRRQKGMETYETLIIDPQLPEADRMSGLGKNWARNWKRAGKKDIRVKVTTSGAGIEEFQNLYAQMKQLKPFEDTPVLVHLANVQDQLPDEEKLDIYLACCDGTPVAGIVVWKIGNRAYRILAATSKEGRKLGAAFYLDWHIVDVMRAKNINHYDLCGIDPKYNPGVHSYKKGLSGKTGTRIELPGHYWACRNNIVESAAKFALKLRERKRI